MQENVPQDWESLSQEQLRILAEELAKTNVRLRQEIVERQKLEKALKARTRELDGFAYSVAHDLRSPLVTLSGFARRLRTDIKAGQTDMVEEDIQMIERGAARMEALIGAALEYARAGQIIGPRIATPFKEIAEQALADCREQLRASGVAVRLANIFPTVMADRLSISRVLTNLIRNCIDHRDESRSLEIEIGYHLAHGDCLFFVRDNGKGIEPVQQRRTFDIFYAIQGKGIGLAIAKKIVEAHGGRIWLESEEGRGTSVIFALSDTVASDSQADSQKSTG